MDWFIDKKRYRITTRQDVVDFLQAFDFNVYLLYS